MIIELHLLQNVAPSCLNRDDANAPKDCDFGGYRRARISSQCIKRSIREEFRNTIPDKTGFRSKLAAEKLSSKVSTMLPDKNAEEIQAAVLELLAAYFAKMEKDSAKSSVLIFFDDEELDMLAEALVNELVNPSPSKSKKKDSGSIAVDKIIKSVAFKPSSIDIALFGRMLAENPGRNIDGSCQVAHAISTNRVAMEFDFFTAVDDLQNDSVTGAGMMGSVGFNSSCFYRYSVIHIDRLRANLVNDETALKDAVQAYISASFTAMPTGKQNSFAAHNPPSFAFAVVRNSNMPWSLANAFERPIRPDEKRGLVANSVSALNDYWKGLSNIYSNMSAVKSGAVLALQSQGLTDADFSELVQYKQSDLAAFVSAVTNSIPS